MDTGCYSGEIRNLMLSVEIDSNSGFCGGVIRAISTAEKYLDSNDCLYSLGAIVHNEEELARLGGKGLRHVESIKDIPAGEPVLVRAHGVPPEVYSQAEERGILVIDCTCPVVLRIQRSIREAAGRVLIFGKHGHPEVLGLVGQTPGAVVFQNMDQLEEILSRIAPDEPVDVFSQTTMSPVEYQQACRLISERVPAAVIHKTICSQVASRHSQLESFAANHDVVVFVSGKTSSNGKVLCDLCRSVNPRTYHISTVEEIDHSWFAGVSSVGVCGATSTPKWLLDKVARAVEETENLQ